MPQPHPQHRYRNEFDDVTLDLVLIRPKALSIRLKLKVRGYENLATAESAAD